MTNVRFISPSSQKTQITIGNYASDDIYEHTIATAGQTIIPIKSPFTPGVHQLSVYRNREFQQYGIDFTETDQNTVEFLSPLNANDSILVTAKGVYSERLHEEQIAVIGETVVNLQGSYHVGLQTLLVFLNGQLLRNLDDYNEVDMKTVAFTRAFTGGEKLVFHEQM